MPVVRCSTHHQINVIPCDQLAVVDVALDALAAMFGQARAEERAAFLPYYPIGYPDYEGSLAAVEAMAGVGVDGFEIGMPFSDPLADGPTIQAATQAALANGVTVSRCLEAVREGVEKEEAEAIKAKLEEQGATVELK